MELMCICCSIYLNFQLSPINFKEKISPAAGGLAFPYTSFSLDGAMSSNSVGPFMFRIPANTNHYCNPTLLLSLRFAPPSAKVWIRHCNITLM